ncbi:MAG: TIGR03000 domain-containing protein [Gemmataceae bacterium]|nr:TIGR03000 domain-containing protein [Gemmataceae bacterium]
MPLPRPARLLALAAAFLAAVALTAGPARTQEKKDDPKPAKDEPKKDDGKKKDEAKKEAAKKVQSKLKITVPEENAELTIKGTREEKTKPTGATREFVTPDIDPGKEYEYDFVVVWRPNNYTKLTRKKTVTFKAGDEVAVDLTKADPKVPDEAVVRWVPTPDDIVAKMVEMAKVTKDDVVYEPGPGDGKVLIAAVKAGAKKAVGIEIDPEKVKEAKGKVKEAGLDDKITIVEGDALKDRDYSEASVVFLYMGNEFLALLQPVLQKQLKPGTRIVSHRFVFGKDWPPDQTVEVKGEDGDDYKLHIWTVGKKGEKKADAKKDEDKKDDKKEETKKDKP